MEAGVGDQAMALFVRCEANLVPSHLQRDGQTNPANFNHHRLAICQLRDAVAALPKPDRAALIAYLESL